jgi:hypothetical protein
MRFSEINDRPDVEPDTVPAPAFDPGHVKKLRACRYRSRQFPLDMPRRAGIKLIILQKNHNKKRPRIVYNTGT